MMQLMTPGIISPYNRNFLLENIVDMTKVSTI